MTSIIKANKMKITAVGFAVVTALVWDQPAYSASSGNQITEWVQQGELLRDSGQLQEAQDNFDKALKEAAGQPDVYLPALTASGYNALLLNNTEAAEQQLKEAYEKSAKGNSYLHALAGEYLGTLYRTLGADDRASFYFNAALEQAKANAFHDLEAGILLQQASDQNVQPAAIADKIAALPDGYAKARLLLQWAEWVLDSALNGSPLAEQPLWADKAYHAISAAQLAAIANKDKRFQAESLIALARLYYQQARYEDVLVLVDQGFALASEMRASELLVKLNRLKGDSLKRQGNISGALQAYTEAVATLGAIKNELPINLPSGQSSVEVLIDPVYRGYVDLLLLSTNKTNAASGEATMLAAINSMEVVKNADMQDYLLSRCSNLTEKHGDWTHQSYPNTALLYPIIFKDRLVLILKSGDKYYHHTVNVSADDIQRQSAALVSALQNGKNYKPAAKQLNQWFLAPVRAELQHLKTQTIIYVPDRSVRGMPISALYDGKHFAVEQQAIVTLPELDLDNLFRPKAANQNRETLIAGISRPDGPSIDQLPSNIAANLAGVSSETLSEKESEKSRQSNRKHLVDSLSLPSVETEVNKIASMGKSQLLLNKTFTADTFKTDLESAKYANVHLASHGYFGKNIKDSFVMAYDKNISFQDFDDTLKNKNLKQNPIELLTLSACETAEGNDRMLLGFSGLAVKSNALSAVGSLWSIDDAAALQFMKTFYSGLNNSLSKAQAMQQAQVAMIQSHEFHHPYYWSPFVLIGNWQ